MVIEDMHVDLSMPGWVRREMERIPIRAARAFAFLDAKEGREWPHHIKGAIHTNSAFYCLFGQLFGLYTTGCLKHGLPFGGPAIVALGLMPPKRIRNFPHFESKYSGAMSAEMERLLRARRETLRPTFGTSSILS